MIQRSFLKFLSRPAQPLHLAQQGIGRWTIHYEPSIVSKKVDWANEDHCGVCESIAQPDAVTVTENEVTIMLGCCCEVPS